MQNLTYNIIVVLFDKPVFRSSKRTGQHFTAIVGFFVAGKYKTGLRETQMNAQFKLKTISAS